MEFSHLALASLAWFLLHAAVAGSGLRFWLVARLGAKAYQRGFSVASLLSLWWLVHEYGRAPFRALWLAPAPLSWLPVVLVPPAFILALGAFTQPSPTALGGEPALRSPQAARGVLRITRHPFLWSAVCWALAHLLANPDLGSLLFFGSIGLTALKGAFDIDRKRRRTNPEDFARFEAVTSNVPLLALLSGRNRLVLRELWLPALLAVLLTSATLWLHPYFFGAPALPRG